MSAFAVNTKLIDSLAQVILALSAEEQVLLGQKLQDLSSARQDSLPDLETFFSSLSSFSHDSEQPSLEAIVSEVKAVRRELWQHG